MNTITVRSSWRRLAALLWLCLAIPAWANVPPPDALLESVSTEMIDALEAEREAVKDNPERLFTLVEEILVPHVDTETMARMVLGAHWRRASEEQRARFTEQFKTLMIRFYVSALLDDPSELDRLLEQKDRLIQILPTQHGEDERRARVRAEVRPPEGPVVPVSFSLYRREAGDPWQVYDVNVEGISIIINYRNSFGSQISREGLDALIQELTTRNQQLWEKAANGNGSAAE